MPHSYSVETKTKAHDCRLWDFSKAGSLKHVVLFRFPFPFLMFRFVCNTTDNLLIVLGCLATYFMLSSFFLWYRILSSPYFVCSAPYYTWYPPSSSIILSPSSCFVLFIFIRDIKWFSCIKFYVFFLSITGSL